MDRDEGEHCVGDLAPLALTLAQHRKQHMADWMFCGMPQ
jgi:hypothetical protein